MKSPGINMKSAAAVDQLLQGQAQYLCLEAPI